MTYYSEVQRRGWCGVSAPSIHIFAVAWPGRALSLLPLSANAEHIHRRGGGECYRPKNSKNSVTRWGRRHSPTTTHPIFYLPYRCLYLRWDSSHKLVWKNESRNSPGIHINQGVVPGHLHTSARYCYYMSFFNTFRNAANAETVVLYVVTSDTAQT